jgi:NAD(P)-dependent dehydrogenase (short-subunit alcohol dehydrogenase family)
MNGKVCVVTGATSGIGKAAASALARLGAQVVLVGRDRDRAAATLKEVEALSSAPPRLEIADLTSLAQVRELAGRLGELDRVDVLINNAGLIVGERRTTPDGFEHMFAVNHLAPFLLTNLMLPKLQASAPARVITVTSDAHEAARFDLDDMQLTQNWSSWRAYSNSKLANILFTRELARRLDGTNVTANCAHPGFVRSGFGREGSRILRLGVRISRPFQLTPERGADTIVYLASSPEVAGASGGYYVKRKLEEPSKAAREDEAARRLWEQSEELTGLAPARPTGS